MAKHKEIEVKWDADQVPRAEFNRKLRAFLASKEFLYRFIRVSGPDTYFADEHGRTIRHRISKNTHELTSKMRLYKKSIRTRKEVNVRLALDQPVDDVFELLSMMGLKMDVSITKDCDIYFINGATAHVSIVWYIVHKKGRDDKVFVEVEVEGLSHRRSLKVLKVWMKRLKLMYGLKDKDISDDSLYEIYTGKRYHNVERRGKNGKQGIRRRRTDD